jgi:GAF domain-containing protein
MTMDRTVVQASLQHLREAIPPDADLVTALSRVAETTQHLFDSAGAGVMVLDDEQALAYVETEDEDARRLEVAQREVGQGPCIDCLVMDDIVRTDDVQADERWPLLRKQLEGSSVHAVLGVPITIAGGAIGSFNVYRDSSTPWDDAEVEAMRTFAAVVEDLVRTALLARSQEQLARQLQHALESRTVIERAVGFVMASQGVDAVAAFDGLRRQARAERRKVVHLAAEILESGTTRGAGAR